MRYLILAGLFLMGLTLGALNRGDSNEKEGDVLEVEPVKTVCAAPIQSGLLSNKIKGISLVAPPNPFSNEPMLPLNELGVDYIAVIPYGYFKKNDSSIKSFSSGGWWGDRPEGVCNTIERAHDKGLKVLLKPQLWTHNQWIGDLDFENDKAWKAFEKNYTRFILGWARVADSMNIEILCVGTEIRRSTEKRPKYWRGLIKKIRKIYKGKLTYAPNWDDYDKVTFWDALDYIGVDAYFPLSSEKTPTVCALKEAWQPTLKTLKAYSKKWKTPILFTEYGYLSLDGCAGKTWELEKDRQSVDINQQGQANAVQALLEVFAEEDWWAGGFLWKWYPNYSSAMGEGKRARDYTPQGKLTEEVMRKMFSD
ncbi:MAG: FIG00930477: hypothetical protein [uncultured Aureispira sp.]|uniref:Glycoside hydrolase n=1 Tax=uncultured Aureispira sp. TaxID=1331704 RepID=A0A6S6TP54_9BACT|nr:MAG: FIG00930477: hypothetical protein [uncultured Aureispira sp.]